jgi:hypothetical protein
MQQFLKFIAWRLCMEVAVLSVGPAGRPAGPTTTNNTATTTLQR